MYNRKQLTNMTVPELKIIAETNRIQFEGLNKETLIDQILFSFAKEPDVKPEEHHDEPEEPKEAPQTTITEIKKAVARHILQGMEVYYNPKDETWLFRKTFKGIRVRDLLSGEIAIRDVPKEDSGTTRQPLKTIKRCADILMSGAAVAQVKADMKKPGSDTTSYEKIA